MSFLSHRLWMVLGVLLVAGAAGCQTQLMPTPNIYASGRYRLYEDIDPALRTSTVDLLYVTDRAPVPRKDGGISYGYERSHSLAFGSCAVEIGRNVDWETLVANSTVHKRSVKLPMKVRSIRELGRLHPTPLPLMDVGGELMDDPDALAQQLALAAVFGQEVRRRLALTPVKEAYLFVHGYNNTFDYAAEVLAEFWHFGGRPGVPILYTWPSGSPGLLRGYTHDRESGEFTIYHLKQLIRALATIPELRRINVIAHSRGTDVAASALRELLIEERGAGRVARESFRIGHVVLASPDVDIDVSAQRFTAERFHRACESLTVYVSGKDKAIGLADWLFRSRRRLGQIRPEDLTETQKKGLGLIPTVYIVDCRVKSGFLGHSYFHSSPAVSSDLILALRYGAAPGSPGRPLEQAFPGYWVLDDEKYPLGGD